MSTVADTKKGEAAAEQKTSILSRNRQFLSTFTMVASILCAIDCTVFPILLTILPAAELFGGVDLHAISHSVALYVVMPIGSLTTLSNYLLHRDARFAVMSTVGLSLILASNAEGLEHLVPLIRQLHMHESRVYNTVGCGLLIGSSWLSHRVGGGHEHDHGHHHYNHHHGQGEEGKEEEEKMTTKAGCCIKSASQSLYGKEEEGKKE